MAFTPGEVVIEVDVNAVPFRWVARGRFVELWWKPGGGDGEWQFAITVGNDDEGWTILNRMAARRASCSEILGGLTRRSPH